MPELSYAQQMQRGHQLLDAGPMYAAVANFMGASTKTEDSTELSRALQMVGVAFRKIGNLSKAIEYGDRALKEARFAEGPSVTAGAARDLAASLHTMAVARGMNRLINLRQALELYDLSLEYDTIGRLPPFSPASAPASEQYFLTLGMRALLIHDMTHYRAAPWRSNVLSDLREADAVLAKSDNRVWELNNLLRLIQVTPPLHRAPLVHRAEDLIVHYPARNKELWVALFGRRAMRLAVQAKAQGAPR